MMLCLLKPRTNKRRDVGYISSELSADEARHLSGGAYDPYGTGHHCEYNGCGQKGYWGSDDRWHSVRDDD